MNRLPAIDLLRGLVIALMALDHTRDYFSDALTFSPTDVAKTNGPLFFTRWVTHFCAPVFVLLAGVGAAFTAKRMTRPDLAKFLILRGLWLVILELTLVRLGFYFTFDFHDLAGLVIWTLGWSMVLLAGLQYLPRHWLIAVAVAMIACHNAYDSITTDHMPEPVKTLWIVLHAPGTIELGNGYTLNPPYKLVPWVGVMALGFAMAPLFSHPRRRLIFTAMGLACILGFLAVRGINRYGDPVYWTVQETPLKTAMAFLNCEKYPPSLGYLLMTLGPAFVGLAVFDRAPTWFGRRLIVLGRVPLFFYLLHLPLIHGLAILCNWIDTGNVAAWLVAVPSQAQAPEGYGYELWKVYLAWLAVLLVLYPLCVGFGTLKKRHPGGILSYL